MKLVEKRNKNFKQIFFGAGAFIAILSFTAFAANLFSPIILTHADSSSTTTEFVLNAAPYLSVGSDNGEYEGGNGSTEITPSISGTTGIIETRFTVNTNIVAGYEIYFSSTDENVNLVHETKDDYYLSPVDAAGVKLENFQSNTWGYYSTLYSTSEIKYYPIPKYSEQKRLYTYGYINEVTGGSSVHNTFYTKYGIKIDNNVPSGTYSKNVLYTVIPHSVIEGETRTIFDITSLQDMNEAICRNTTMPDSSATTFITSFTKDKNYIPKKKLVDTRDNKEYDVVRYADGSCWMLQDLDLELSTSKTLTSADTNLKNGTSWTPLNNTTSTLTDWGDPRGDIARTDHSVRVTTDGSTAVLYNLSAATGGILGRYDHDENGNPVDRPDDNGNFKTNSVFQDICPRGWRMMTGYGYSDTFEKMVPQQSPYTSRSDFTILLGNSTYSYYKGYYEDYVSSFFDSPFLFTKHGMIQNNGAGSAVERAYNGTGAIYWTSNSSYCNSREYENDDYSTVSYCKSPVAYISASSPKEVNWNTYSGVNSGYRNYGAAIRCVAKVRDKTSNLAE